MLFLAQIGGRKGLSFPHFLAFMIFSRNFAPIRGFQKES
jgi:hypothetical protein